MILRYQLIHFVWFNTVYDVDKLTCISKITVLQKEFRAPHMGILVETVYPFRVERTGTANNAMNSITF
jgi:hypothetical protein